MDMGTAVAWIQFGIWIIAIALWIGRITRGESHMPLALKKLFSSNGLIGTVVVLGLVMSGISLYLSYSLNAMPKLITVNISTYAPQYPSPLRIVSDQTFKDQDVPLDGYIYQRCKFINVCFLYDGSSYEIQNSTVTNNWKVCVKDQRLSNYSDLMDGLKMFSPKIEHTSRVVVNR